MRRGTLSFAIALATSGAVVTSYEQPVHLVITAAIAEMAGFTPAEAFEIAKYDWGTDHDPATDPFPKGVSATERARALRARRDFHFVSQARLGELSANADKACTGSFGSVQHKALGQYLHALEDSFSHRDFGPEFGHVSAGTSPDKPWNDPAVFREMFAAKFNALLRLRGRCRREPNRTVVALARYETAVKVLDAWVAAENQAGIGDFLLGNERRWENATKQLLGADFDRLSADNVRRYQEWLAQQRAKGWAR